MDDEEDMTLSLLGTCQFGHRNAMATTDLSTDDCDRKDSDELDEVNNNTNNIIKISGKAEEGPGVVESDYNSELMKNESENPSTDEEIVALSMRNKQYICKVTDKDAKEEHHETNDDNIPQNPTDLFHDSNGDKLSTSDNILTNKGDIKTGSDNKRKAANGNDNTEDGKKKRGHNED